MTRLTRAVAAGCASVLSTSAIAHAADRSWQNPAGGIYNVNTNWNPNVVPLPADNGIFNLGPAGYVVTFNSGTLSGGMIVRNDQLTLNLSTFTLNLVAAGGLQLADLANNTSRLTVSNGTLAVTAITLANGANSSATGTFGAGAIVTSTAAMNIASIGAATLTVDSAGQLNSAATVGIGIGSSATGSLLISGAGSSWIHTGSQPSIGVDGSGSLTVAGGATISIPGLALGTNAGTGAFSVRGAASTATLTSGSIVGSRGRGLMSVFDNASVNATSITIGNELGATGIASVSGNAALSLSNALTIGAAGSGSLTVSSGGDVTAAANAVIASVAGGTGSLIVEGTGSTFTSSLVPLSVGGGGDATLDIRSGGLITSPGLTIGTVPGSAGSVSLDGQASRLDVATLGVFVGGGSVSMGGSGQLAVQPGATLNIGSAARLRIYPAGAVNLNGGSISTGSLEVQSGGAFNFNSGSLTITGAPGMSIGVGTPLGAALTLDASKTLTIVNTATLNAGAIVHMTGGVFNAGAIMNFGELLLADRTSLVSSTSINNLGLITGDGRISGALFNDATGEIRVDAGDRLTFFNGTGSSSNSGRINLFGGTLEIDFLTNNATGRITGRGVLSGPTINNGTVTFSAGTSDVLATYFTNPAAKTIVTGGSTTTFFASVANLPGSEFRVSSGSTAVFLGNVSGLSQFTGGGTKIFEGPTSLGALDTSGATVVEAGGQLTAQHVREMSLTIFGLATIEPDGTINGTSNVQLLTIDGGTTPTGALDLSDNALVVDYTGFSPRAALAAQIKFARNGGAWNQPGITSSLANAAQFALGIAERASLLSVPPIFGTVDADAVLIRFTRYGDANLDGIVNVNDFTRLATNFNQSGKFWSDGDFNYDGIVNVNDFTLLGSNFGLAATGPDGSVTPQDWASLAAAVPEPVSIGVPLAAVLLGVRRVGRQR